MIYYIDIYEQVHMLASGLSCAQRGSCPWVFTICTLSRATVSYHVV